MLKEIIERGREMEDKYGHFFDYILVNQDMDRAYEELLQEINRLEVEPQWVPIQWVDSQSLQRNQLVNKLFIYITWPAIVYGPHNGEGSTVVGLLKVVVTGNLQRGPFFISISTSLCHLLFPIKRIIFIENICISDNDQRPFFI